MADQPEERWVTYRELGAQLGCTENAARMHAQRRRWPRRAPNKVGGATHVLVPESVIVRERATHTEPVFDAQSIGSVRAQVLAHNGANVPTHTISDSAVERTIATLCDVIKRAERRSEELQTALIKAEVALADAQAAAQISAVTAAGLRAELDQLRTRRPWWRRWAR